MKKALMIASMASMLDNFNRKNIEILLDMGYSVTLAANFNTFEDSNPIDKIREFKQEMAEKGCKIVHINFSRNLFSIRQQFSSCTQLKQLAAEQYEIVHCHSPICAAQTRWVFKRCRNMGLKIIYTAHGFHFYKGAPVKNWLLYFPVEWICSFWTDVLITINKEDYVFAQKHLHAKKTEHVPGVGIDTRKFSPDVLSNEERLAFRAKLGLKQEDKVLLSVGELNKNKNHKIVIQALAKLQDKSINYVVAGTGELHEYLLDLARTLGISERVHILGYRDDVCDLYKVADIYILPSLREGLNMSLMEAMASGLPVACSKIRGNTDLIDEGKGGFFFNPEKVDTVISFLVRIINSFEIKYGEYNREKIKKYSLEKVSEKMMEIYGRVTK